MAKYDNCRILDPDGIFIGFCDYKRFNWYLKKDLATKINEKTIQLKFRPKIKDEQEYKNQINDPTYCEELSNNCVVCGSMKNLNKIHIVPLEFKKYFPLKIKSHNNKTIVLMCQDCNDDYNRYFYEFKLDLFEMFDICTDHELVKLKNYAKTALKPNTSSKNLITSKKNIEEYLKRIPTDDDLKRLSELNCYSGKNFDGTQPVQEFIVNKYIQEDNLDEFEKMFIDNFINSMQPLFLPKYFLV